MRARRICLISPGQLATNPRLVKEGRALSDAGYDVHVVCGRFAPWARDYEAALVDSRWSISYVPFGPFEVPTATYLLQSLRRHSARALLRAGSRAASLTETAHAPVVPGLCAAARKIPADLYVAHYVAALPAAALAAGRHGARYAFDAEDFHAGDFPDAPENTFEQRIVRDIEGRYLPGAAYVTAASPMIADAYASSYGIALPTTVLNTFPRANAPQCSTPRGWASPGPSLYWFSQTIGPGRGLETAVEAIGRASSSPHLYLRGTPAMGYEMQLRTFASERGVADSLHLLPPGDPSEMERLGAQYDVGYVGELPETSNRQIALTNKLFSYLCSGIPILASDIPSHKAIAADVGNAMTLFRTSNAADLAAALDMLVLDPIRLAAARACAWQMGQERYCWESEQSRLLKVVTTALLSESAKV